MPRMVISRLVFLVVILAIWQAASGTLVSEFFISSPAAIGRQLWIWLTSGELVFHAQITIIEAVLGFALGSTLGILAGLGLGRNEFVASLLDPFITSFYSLPKLALAPLFILWLGIGIEMKVVLTASIVFFLVFLNTYSGVKNVSQEQVTILRLMGARESHILTKVVLPSAITWVFVGLRLSVPYAVTGAVVGEIIASNRGLGYLLQNSAGQFDTAGVFAAIFAIMFLALVINVVVKRSELLLMPWRNVNSDRELSV